MGKLINGINVKFYDSDKIHFEKNAISELENLTEVTKTIEKLKEYDNFFDDMDSNVLEIAATPDFHKGAGTPIGTVILSKGMILPQTMGNDINCGMRVYTTNLTEEQIYNSIKKIHEKIRHVFFEGGRDIPMTKIQRQEMFKNGLSGLLDTSHMTKDKGIWKLYDRNEQEKQLNYVKNKGSMHTDYVTGLDSFLNQDGITYDSQIGSIGGGNHFVEVQKVAEVLDGQTANAWNLKKGTVLIMIHTGSLDIGHQSGTYIKNLIQGIYPDNLKQPENNIYVLPKSEKYKKEWDSFWSIAYNAANFGFANRLFLGLMMKKSLMDVIGEFDLNLLYDSQHNFIWEQKVDDSDCYIHRKGACSSAGFMHMVGTPFEYYGEPVMIPGSMGSSSYILAGLGNRDSIFSSSHGAGRNMSRGNAIKEKDELFNNFIDKFDIITPIDITRQDIKNRADILKKWKDEIKSEAPYAYKNIYDIIKAHIDNEMAKPIARLEPIFTIKN